MMENDIDTSGTSKWIKNIGALVSMLGVVLGMFYSFAAYLPQIQTKVFHREQDTLSIDQQEAIFSNKAEEHIKILINNSFSGRVDSNAQRINMLFDFINRPGSEKCAVGIRSTPRTDSLWYRDTRCMEHDCWVDQEFQWWKYYDAGDREFKAAYFEEPWNEFKFNRAMLLMSIMNPEHE